MLDIANEIIIQDRSPNSSKLIGEHFKFMKEVGARLPALLKTLKLSLEMFDARTQLRGVTVCKNIPHLMSCGHPIYIG